MDERLTLPWLIIAFWNCRLTEFIAIDLKDTNMSPLATGKTVKMYYGTVGWLVAQFVLDLEQTFDLAFSHVHSSKVLVLDILWRKHSDIVIHLHMIRETQVQKTEGTHSLESWWARSRLHGLQHIPHPGTSAIIQDVIPSREPEEKKTNSETEITQFWTHTKNSDR